MEINQKCVERTNSSFERAMSFFLKEKKGTAASGRDVENKKNYQRFLGREWERRGEEERPLYLTDKETTREWNGKRKGPREI